MLKNMNLCWAMCCTTQFNFFCHKEYHLLELQLMAEDASSHYVHKEFNRYYLMFMYFRRKALSQLVLEVRICQLKVFMQKCISD